MRGKVPQKDLLSEEEKTAITRQVQRRMFWKLIVVAIVVGAYVTLRALETATQSYEDERGRPIVLVGEEISREHATAETNVIADKYKCPRLYDPNSSTPPKKASKATLVRLCEARHLISDPDESTAVAVKKRLGRLENHYFPDEQSIISRLDQDIRAEADLEKRALLSIEEAENRKRASKLPNISKEEALVDDALRQNAASEIAPASTSDPDDALHQWIKKQWDELPKEKLYASDEQIQNWQKRLNQVSNGSDKPLETSQLLVLHQTIVGKADYKVHFKLLKKEISEIDDNAQKQIKVVYEKLAPALGDLVKVSPGAPDLPATNEFRGWFHPRTLLDTRTGAHVIYETVHLTLAMVLVLGVIFLLFLVLRFLPFFAGSTDQLTEQAKAFLQRSGGTMPPIAKSLVVTASALALGTAVVVAGNKAINPTPHVDPIYDPGYDDGEGKGRRLPGDEGGGKPPRPPQCQDCVEVPPGDGVDVHVVKLEEPIAYPSPITISGPSSLTLTPESIDGVKTVIQELLKSTKVPATVPDTELELRIRKITETVITEKLTTVTATCCKAGGDANFGPDSFAKLIGPTLTTIGIIQKDLDATKKTLAEIQNKDVQPQTDSGGRGILTRTKQFFKGDKYLVTRETVDALRSLMSKPTDCRSTTTTDAAKQKCCGDKMTAYCPDSTSDTILSRLQNMIGNPPASESDFMKQLRDSKTRRDQVDKAIDQWKSVILRHARVPY